MESNKRLLISIIESSRHSVHLPCVKSEIWLDVPGWPYQASDLGNIRRVVDKSQNIFGHNLKGGTYKDPAHHYPVIVLCRDTETGKERRCFSRHAVITVAFLGPTPEGMEIDHENGDRSDCRIENLSFKTPSENIKGSVRRGHRGSNRWNAVLNEDKVRAIRHLYREGKSIGWIADQFALNFTTTYHVVRYDNWKHVA
jgi:hypothetical protein